MHTRTVLVTHGRRTETPYGRIPDGTEVWHVAEDGSVTFLGNVVAGTRVRPDGSVPDSAIILDQEA